MDENIESSFQDDQLSLTESSKQYLTITAKWANFLSIISFIFICLMLIGSFFIKTIFSSMGGLPEEYGQMGGSIGTMIAFFYFILALVYFFPTIYLFRFSKKMQVALTREDEGVLTDAFENLKSVFKFWGIFTIVIMAFYALFFIIALFMGGMPLGGGGVNI